MSDLGDLLRRARAHKGVTLRDAEKRTRISRTYLAALEAHDFDQLPPRAYARGIVRTYAQYLGLDPAAVLSMFEAASAQADRESDDAQVVPAVQPIEIHGHWAPNFAIIIFMLVISAVIFTWIYSAYLQPDENALPTAVAQPTATSVDQSLLDMIALTPSPSVASDEAAGGEPSESASADAATATPEVDSEAETSTEALSDATEPEGEAEPTATEEETSGDGELPPDLVVPEGYHVFRVVAEDDVWVNVTLDGETIALDRVLAAGQSETFLAQTATITSGNAANVRVYVDGDDYGTLGEPWDVIVTYP